MRTYDFISVRALLFGFIDVMLMILFVFSILSMAPYHSSIFSTHSTLISNSLWKRLFLMFLFLIFSVIELDHTSI